MEHIEIFADYNWILYFDITNFVEVAVVDKTYYTMTR